MGKSGSITKRKPEIALASALPVNIIEYEFAIIFWNFSLFLFLPVHHV